MNIFSKIGEYANRVRLPEEKSGRWLLVFFLVLLGLVFLPFAVAFFLIRGAHNRIEHRGMSNVAIAVITIFTIFVGGAWVSAMGDEPDSPDASETSEEVESEKKDDGNIVQEEQPPEEVLEKDGSEIDESPEEKSEDTKPVVAGNVDPNDESEPSESNDTTTDNPTPTSSESEEGSTQDSESQTAHYDVVDVVDGDTAKLSMNGTVETVRLIGIDTPETVHPSEPVECFGAEASSRAQELLEGKSVRFETDDSQDTRDTYGRLLGYIILPDGRNFNKLMIEEGYAYEYTYSVPYKYQSEFKFAQEQAEQNERGLWDPSACQNFEEEEESDSQPEPEQEQEPEEDTSSSAGGKWYASSYRTAEYYYHESCDGWQGLSESYLQVYDSENEVQTDNPDYTLHHECNP